MATSIWLPGGLSEPSCLQDEDVFASATVLCTFKGALRPHSETVRPALQFNNTARTGCTAAAVLETWLLGEGES